MTNRMGTGKDVGNEGWGHDIMVVALVGLALVGLYAARGVLPIAEWYGVLNLPTATLSEPIGDLADRVNIPLLSALVFGVLGALSPCQLSTNVAALAYTTRYDVGRVPVTVIAYVVGKALVYTLIGLAAILLGTTLQQAAIPVIVAARKVLGPTLLLVGLSMVGVVRLRISVGDTAAGWLERHIGGRGVAGAFGMGVAFAVAFCPTLFWLFFGLTLPLAIASPLGFVYPAVFAVGTALPLVVFAVLTAGVGMGRNKVLGQAHRAYRPLSLLVGVVFILVGLNEIVLYWLT